MWGLVDYLIIEKNEVFQNALNATVKSLEKKLPQYDNHYWSLYSGNKIASPFYHALHIAQLQVLSAQFKLEAFEYYAQKWERYRHSRLNIAKAMSVKAFQKLCSPDPEIIIVE